MDCEPLMDLLPDHAPEAVHEVALVADHVRVELLPLITELGLAPSVIVGAGVDSAGEWFRVVARTGPWIS